MFAAALLVVFAAGSALAGPEPGAVTATSEATAEAAPQSASAPAQPAPELATQTFPGDPLGVTRVVLDNGLTVYLSENHEAAEVFGAVVVRTGAKNDPPEHTGMAHYLEHMLFKGTTSLGTTNWAAEKPLQERLEALYEQLRTATPEQQESLRKEIAATVKKTYAYTVPNELDQLLEQIGGTGINAFTSYDETVYHNTFPASQVGTWLALYAHRFQNPVFRLFPTELEAVYEEKNIALDTFGYELYRKFLQAAFPNHPYGKSDILGEVEHLKKPSLRAMKRYFDEHYTPGNMALVLSGDFSTAEVLPLVREHFGAWEARPAPESKPRALAPFAANQRMTVRLTPIRVGAVAYHTVPESHPDYAALLLARRLLTNEQGSGFIDRLGDEGKLLLAMHIAADFTDHNLDVVAYAPRLITQTFRAAEKIITEQFDKVAGGEFSDTVFAALKEGLLAEEKASWEDNEDRALQIAHAFVAHGDWHGHLQYLEALQRVSKADVMRVAKTYFGDRRLVLRSRVGFPKKTRLEKPEHPAVTAAAGRHSQAFEDFASREGGEPKVDLVDFAADVATKKLREGVTLRTNPNPTNDLYQLELVFGVGDDAIRELAVLEDYLGRIGTRQTSAEAFKQRLFELSTTLSFYSEPDRFTVRLDGPEQHIAQAVDLLGQLLADAEAERKPLRQLRRETWGYRRLSRKNPPYVAQALRDYVLYGRNSDFIRDYGPMGMRGLQPRELMKAWRKVQQYAVEVRYVGNRSTNEIGALISDRIAFAPQLRPAVAPIVYPRFSPSQSTVYFIPRRDAVQTQIWFAVEGQPVGAKEQAAADAFSEYLGGSMAGLVFQEIREFRALAYSAQGRFHRDLSPLQRGHFLAYIGCQADKTFEAVDVMMGLIEEMPRKEDRMGFVKASLVRSQETMTPSFRELQDQIDTWKRMGYSDDPRRQLLPHYEALEFADIESFYRKHVAGKPVSMMVVGDPRKIDAQQLRRYGKVIKVREGKLFSR